MTKLRHPLTFPDAVTRIAGRIGWAAAADACGKSERSVRAWSDPELGREPCLEDALALDAAYLRAGGGEPPLMTVYATRLERAAEPAADSAELARATAVVAKETGEAVAALVAASMPGAPSRERAVAEREVAEAVEALTDAQRKLGSAAPALRVAS